MPGQKTVKWNPDTMQAILAARNELVAAGMERPPIRAVLYMMLRLPGWTKNHYDTLTVKLGEWRDVGLIEFGLFADDTGGGSYRPMTSKEVVEATKELEDYIPARLMPDGYLHAVFVEHVALVDNVARWLDYAVPVVSSQGQLRREHLHSFMAGCERVVKELGGHGIKAWGLTDYDLGGQHIFNAHARWLRAQFSVDLQRWAITPAQLKAAKLPTHEPHQLDGWMASYGPNRVRAELRALVGIDKVGGKPKKKAKKAR